MGGNWALQSHHGSCRLQSTEYPLARSSWRVVVAAAAGGSAHTDQPTGETRRDKKKRTAGQAGSPGKAVGNRIPPLLMQPGPSHSDT